MRDGEFPLRSTYYALSVYLVQRPLDQHHVWLDLERLTCLIGQRFAHHDLQDALTLFTVPRAYALGRAVVAAGLIDGFDGPWCVLRGA